MLPDESIVEEDNVQTVHMDNRAVDSFDNKGEHAEIVVLSDSWLRPQLPLLPG